MGILSTIKMKMANRLFGDIYQSVSWSSGIEDATGGSRELSTGLVKKVGIRQGDLTNTDFEDPEIDLEEINNGYNTDGYIRQGVDKYVDQIFKEGYQFYGKDSTIVDYLKLRFAYMAEASGIPTEQLFIEIAEDIVKYGNCMLAKSRAKDVNSLPPTLTITGLAGAEPVAAYFPLNATTMRVKRDKNGVVKGWQQEVDDTKVKFKPEDIVHFYYKREKGKAMGTPFLLPVLEDVKALRQAEENVLKMMYRNIYPFYHVAVGDKESPGEDSEITKVQEAIDDMEVDGGLVTSNRVEIKPIASNQVINAEPYLRYLEDRVFSGMGVPAIMFGRGDTANRSTGDNMTSEMADRIHAIQHSIEMFMNEFVIKELLMEGGYDPVLNPEHEVRFVFKENDLDAKVKQDTHAVYLYEHNAITEDEMRAELGRDPITDRSLMFQTLVTQANEAHSAQVKAGTGGTTSSTTSNKTGTKETNNKVRPSNQHGTKTSPKKLTNTHDLMAYGLLKDEAELCQQAIQTISMRLEDESTPSVIKAMMVKHKQSSLDILQSLDVTDELMTEWHQIIEDHYRFDEAQPIQTLAQFSETFIAKLSDESQKGGGQ